MKILISLIIVSLIVDSQCATTQKPVDTQWSLMDTPVKISPENSVLQTDPKTVVAQVLSSPSDTRNFQPVLGGVVIEPIGIDDSAGITSPKSTQNVGVASDLIASNPENTSNVKNVDDVVAMNPKSTQNLNVVADVLTTNHKSTPNVNIVDGAVATNPKSTPNVNIVDGAVAMNPKSTSNVNIVENTIATNPTSTSNVNIVADIVATNPSKVEKVVGSVQAADNNKTSQVKEELIANLKKDDSLMINNDTEDEEDDQNNQTVPKTSSDLSIKPAIQPIDIQEQPYQPCPDFESRYEEGKFIVTLDDGMCEMIVTDNMVSQGDSDRWASGRYTAIYEILSREYRPEVTFRPTSLAPAKYSCKHRTRQTGSFFVVDTVLGRCQMVIGIPSLPDLRYAIANAQSEVAAPVKQMPTWPRPVVSSSSDSSE